MKETQTPSAHWTQQKERASGYWLLKFCLILFRLLPTIILRLIAFPVGFFYFVFSKAGRTESRRFLTRAAAFIDNPKTAKKCRSLFGPLRHIISFSLCFIEKLQSWSGKFFLKGIHYPDDDINELVNDIENGKGAFLIGSHFGNMDLLRGLVSFDRTKVSRAVPFTAIIDVEVNPHFSRMIRELNPGFGMDIIAMNKVGPESAMILQDKLAAGGMISITGDRTIAPAKAGDSGQVPSQALAAVPARVRSSGAVKNLMIPFFGEEAQFPQSPFYLAALMEAPVYFVFALRRGYLSLRPEYNMHVHKYVPSENSSSAAGPPSDDSAPSSAGGRKERLRLSADMARSFAAVLERYCKKEPFQWYNFYDFWQKEV